MNTATSGVATLETSSAAAFASLMLQLFGESFPKRVATLLWQAPLDGHLGLPFSAFDDDELARLKACALTPLGQRLFRLEFNHVYLARYAAMEARVAAKLKERFSDQSNLSLATQLLAIPASANERQREAIAMGLNEPLLLLTGGPGTGKSFTLRALMDCIAALGDISKNRIAALAPTAQAAQRIAHDKASFVGTVHRFLGVSAGASMGTESRGQVIGFDWVIVDEASMLSAEMFDVLLASIPEGTHLVLSGDHRQLASVEAGAIFAQACAAGRNLVTLNENLRVDAKSSANLVALANWVVGEQDEVDVEAFLHENLTTPEAIVKHAVQGYLHLLESKNWQSDTLVQALRSYKLLTTTNGGPMGSDALNRAIDQEMRRRSSIPGVGAWYQGRAIVILRNDRASQLNNGQTGICVLIKGQWMVQFEDERLIAIENLPLHGSAWAQTVHKSQGGEFDRVIVVLPDVSSPLAQRELLYTAVTRARQQLWLVGSQKALLACRTTGVRRHGALAARLASTRLTDSE